MTTTAYIKTALDNLESGHDYYSKCFEFLDHFSETLQKLHQFLAKNHDKNRESQLLWLHFNRLIEKNILASFTNTIMGQTDLALFPIRSAIEILLILGKIADSEENYHIWRTKFSEKNKKYSALFTGKALISNSISNSKELQGILKTINDYFVHPNPFLYISTIAPSDLTAGQKNYECPFLCNASLERSVVLFALLIVTSSILDGILSIFEFSFVRFPKDSFDRINLLCTFSEEQISSLSLKYKILLEELKIDRFKQ